MNRIYVQALYVTKQGRTYRSQVKVVSEGQELFDFENELKYQLAMKDYPIELVNDHGHRQFIQPADVETIIAAQLGYEQQAVASQAEGRLEPAPKQDIREDIPDENKPDMMFIGVDPANKDGVFIGEHKFSSSLPIPDRPVQKIRVKSTDPDNETTQELELPFAAIDAVRRVTAPEQPQEAARTAFSGPIKVRLGAGTDPARPRP